MRIPAKWNNFEIEDSSCHMNGRVELLDPHLGTFKEYVNLIREKK